MEKKKKALKPHASANADLTRKPLRTLQPAQVASSFPCPECVAPVRALQVSAAPAEQGATVGRWGSLVLRSAALTWAAAAELCWV